MCAREGGAIPKMERKQVSLSLTPTPTLTLTSYTEDREEECKLRHELEPDGAPVAELAVVEQGEHDAQRHLQHAHLVRGRVRARVGVRVRG